MRLPCPALGHVHSNYHSNYPTSNQVIRSETCYSHVPELIQNNSASYPDPTLGLQCAPRGEFRPPIRQRYLQWEDNRRMFTCSRAMIACVRDLPWARPGDARCYGGSFGSCAQGGQAAAGGRERSLERRRRRRRRRRGSGVWVEFATRRLLCCLLSLTQTPGLFPDTSLSTSSHSSLHPLLHHLLHPIHSPPPRGSRISIARATLPGATSPQSNLLNLPISSSSNFPLPHLSSQDGAPAHRRLSQGHPPAPHRTSSPPFAPAAARRPHRLQDRLRWRLRAPR